MVVISFSSLDHRQRKLVKRKIVKKKSIFNSFCFVWFLESGLILTASTVVLTDQKITHVGDPRAVETSCTHVELVDISSNAFSDWQEISLLLTSLPHVKTINLSFNPFPSNHQSLSDDLFWPNLNTICLNASYITLEMVVELLKKTPKLILVVSSFENEE